MRILHLKNLIILIIILFSFYLISPYHKIYKLYNSIKKSDTEFVSKNIDWVNLKSGFKDDFKNIINKAYSQTNNLEKKVLGNLFIQIIIETLVDNLVTPENLILLVNDPDKYKNLIEDKLENPIKKINYIQKINYEEKDFKIKYAFFININKFRVSFLKDDYPISVDFKINSFKWKLNRIYLPVDVIASKINN